MKFVRALNSDDSWPLARPLLQWTCTGAAPERTRSMCYPKLKENSLMTSKTAILATAVSSLLVVSAAAFAADEGNSEKCYGVAKAGKNDCAGAAHVCAGVGGPRTPGK